MKQRLIFACIGTALMWLGILAICKDMDRRTKLHEEFMKQFDEGR